VAAEVTAIGHTRGGAGVGVGEEVVAAGVRGDCRLRAVGPFSLCQAGDSPRTPCTGWIVQWVGATQGLTLMISVQITCLTSGMLQQDDSVVRRHRSGKTSLLLVLAGRLDKDLIAQIK
jgi:hypothetical protein